ncbi:MAG: serine hydrolase, partial [Verrucomicrobia bacterium]|nr:serine hydrolase [Verrucomicrobiota bacterium]
MTRRNFIQGGVAAGLSSSALAAVRAERLDKAVNVLTR